MKSSPKKLHLLKLALLLLVLAGILPFLLIDEITRTSSSPNEEKSPVRPADSSSKLLPAALDPAPPQVQVIAQRPAAKPAAAKPAAQQVENPKFDPRFTQPATRPEFFGKRHAEFAQSLLEREAKESAEKAEAIAWAKANNYPIKEHSNAGSREIMRLNENGLPVYYETDNAEARISHNVAILNSYVPFDSFNINLHGRGWNVGLFESGPPRLSHLEFSGENSATYLDSDPNDLDSFSAVSSHATHVLGTMIGSGAATSPGVDGAPSTGGESRGMASAAAALCFGWNGDQGELQSFGASAPSQPDRFYVSNHSYSGDAGWAWSRSNGRWVWAGDPDVSESKEFGLYSATARSYDRTCRLTPYLLPFVTAGNARGIVPSDGDSVSYPVSHPAGTFNARGTWPAANLPPANGSHNGGYDTLKGSNNGKNVMTVGNATEAVLNGNRSTTSITMNPSSGFGPSDDGRIKPDIVGNGTDILSADREIEERDFLGFPTGNFIPSDTAVSVKSGTSMACPGVTSTALLLHEAYNKLTGQFMRGSTTKALLLHSATDVLDPGPDYKSGWGYVDGHAAYNHITDHAANPGAFHIVEGVLSAERPVYRRTFTADSRVKATLVWTDPEGTDQTTLDSTTKALVNDLDLVLRLPDGSLRYPPSLSAANPSAVATYTGPNDTDNVEMIGGSVLDAIPVQPGTYELVITHRGLTEPDAADPANPKQVFSLMLSGQNPDSIGSIADGVDNTDLIYDNAPAGTSFGFAYEGGVGNDFDRAYSTDIDDNETAAFETTVQGPTTIIFRWGVSSEANFDFMRFYGNGAVWEEISGDTSATVTYDIPAGSHTLRWAYVKDSSRSVGEDRGYVDEIRFNNVNEGIDNFDYAWIQHPIHPWELAVTSQAAVPTGDWASGGDVRFDQFAEMSTTIQGPALVQFTMVQTAPGGALRANYGVGDSLNQFVIHRDGNIYKRYSVVLEDETYSFQFSWRNNQGEPGTGYVDEFLVTPLATNGSLVEATELTNGSLTPNLEQAAWIPDDTNAAPSGEEGEPGASSIRTVPIDTSNFPNSTNNATLEHSITGPALLSFWWQNSGSASSSFQFQVEESLNPNSFVDASPTQFGPRKLDPIPGGTGWQQVHFEVPPGTHNYRWFYQADPNDANAVAHLDQIIVRANLLHPSRGLDHWTNRVEFYGDAPWHAIADESNTNGVPGQGSIDSTTHELISDGESTTLTATVVGPKKLFFDWKVSSEEGYDFISFTLDGEQVIDPISGEVDWTSHGIDIPGGNHVLRWTYSKDGTQSQGADRGWIDNLCLLRPDFGMDFAVAFPKVGRIEIRKGPTGGYFLDSSTDLRTWTPHALGVFTDSRNMLSPTVEDSTFFVDLNGPRTFYRLRYEPEYRHQIENHSFENPDVGFGNISASFPGWTTTGAAGETYVWERSVTPSEGDQFLHIFPGASAGTEDQHLAFRGIHSASIGIGNIAGFTTSGNASTAILRNATVAVGTAVIDAATITASTFADMPPITYDDFLGSSTQLSPLDIQLEANGAGRSFFDHVRLVTEYE